ncbi:hypothetical protein MHYP_G00326340 [Metynnis hypsauchen]
MKTVSRMEPVLLSTFISSKHTQEFRFGNDRPESLLPQEDGIKRTSSTTKAFHFSSVAPRNAKPAGQTFNMFDGIHVSVLRASKSVDWGGRCWQTQMM